MGTHNQRRAIEKERDDQRQERQAGTQGQIREIEKKRFSEKKKENGYVLTLT